MAKDREIDPHPHVTFARAYSSRNTLNAETALARLAELVDDAAMLERSIKQTPNLRPYYGFEIVSYYLVGFVTCLEWHAKSRLLDLYEYRPQCIQAEDLKGNITDKLLSQAVANGLTVPQLLCAAAKVGSMDRYISIFKQVFTELAIASPITELLAHREETPVVFGSLNEEPTDGDQLREIFEFRHHLIHEISNAVVGYPNVRLNLDTSEVCRLGAVCMRIVNGVEKALTQRAPVDFPHRLDEDGHSEDESPRLLSEIEKLERQIETRLEHSKELWNRAARASRSATLDELEFIQTAPELHNRYLDYRRPHELRLLRHRLVYLQAVAAEFCAAYEEGDVLAPEAAQRCGPTD